MNEESRKLSKGYLSDDFFTPDLTVTKYTYKIDGINAKHINAVANKERYIQMTIGYADKLDGMTIYTENCGMKKVYGRDCIIDYIEMNGQEAVFYTFGRPFDEEKLNVVTKLCERSYHEIEEIDAQVEFHTETMTFEEFMLKDYDPQKGLSEIEWYNTVYCDIEYMEGITDYSRISVDTTLSKYKRTNRWYEYAR